jgi:hypothetical protein
MTQRSFHEVPYHNFWTYVLRYIAVQSSIFDSDELIDPFRFKAY